jgi:hypothetical protein
MKSGPAARAVMLEVTVAPPFMRLKRGHPYVALDEGKG